MLPAPMFYDASKVPTVHVERVSLVAEIADEYRKRRLGSVAVERPDRYAALRRRDGRGVHALVALLRLQGVAPLQRLATQIR